ncbi:MAG TPA: translation initiation factor IF-2 N-terminal domain-containing protein, partial [Thermoanaerobaculia bacterium]|nr:translation initiation factor IF-2 N-terminal domain-containing protein [Thermoanaerobaculia bacterium]
MGKIRVQDLAKMMGISNQDLVFKLKSIGVRVEGDDAAIDTDIIQAILQGKKLPHPREVILRDEPAAPTPVSDPARRRAPAPAAPAARRPAANPLRPNRPRTLIQKVEPRIQTLPPSERGASPLASFLAQEGSLSVAEAVPEAPVAPAPLHQEEPLPAPVTAEPPHVEEPELAPVLAAATPAPAPPATALPATPSRPATAPPPPRRGDQGGIGLPPRRSDQGGGGLPPRRDQSGPGAPGGARRDQGGGGLPPRRDVPGGAGPGAPRQAGPGGAGP